MAITTQFEARCFAWITSPALDHSSDEALARSHPDKQPAGVTRSVFRSIQPGYAGSD